MKLGTILVIMSCFRGPKLAKESYALLAINVADLITTLWLITAGHAIEGNPIMSFYANHGLAIFAAAKIVLCVGPIVILEWGRRYRPKFVRGMLRFTIAAYISLYVVVVVNANILATGR